MGRWRGFAMRYQETGEDHDRHRSGRPRKTTARDVSLLVRLTAPQLTALVSSRTVCWILARNGLHGRIAAQKPALNTPRPTAWRKVGQQKSGGHFFFFRWIVSWAPFQAPPILSMTLRGPSGPTVRPEDSQIWRWKDYGFGLHPIRRCQGDL